MQRCLHGGAVSYLAQLHKDIDDAQEVGGGKRGTGITAGHVVLIQRALTFAQSTPAAQRRWSWFQGVFRVLLFGGCLTRGGNTKLKGWTVAW